MTYLVAIVLAVFLDRLFHLSPDQVHVGRVVLLIISVNVAVGTAFTVFGGVINGFQRYDLNNIVGTVSSVVDGGRQRRRAVGRIRPGRARRRDDRRPGR